MEQASTNQSAEQPSTTTGKNSSKSASEESLNWREDLQSRWATALGKLEAARDLVSLETIRRNLKTEDDRRDRWMRDNHALVYGADSEGAKPSHAESGGEGDNEMGHNMVLGDMNIQNPSPPQSPPQQPHKPERSLLRRLLPVAVTAGAVGLGAPWLARPVNSLIGLNQPQQEQKEPTTPQQTDENKLSPSDVDTDLGIRLKREN